MPSTDRLFPTPLGKLIAWSNNGDHAGLRTEWEHNQRGPLATTGIAEVVTINTVEYSFRIHLHRTEPWLKSLAAESRGRSKVQVIEGTEWAYDRWENPLTRRDGICVYGTPSAREKAVSKIVYPFARWLDSPEGKAFTVQAEEDDTAQVLANLKDSYEVLDTACRNLLRIQAKIEQGKQITPDEKRFARYVRLTNNLGDAPR